MTKSVTVPSDDKAQFLVCEDVREEKGNKFTLLGFMPEPKLQVESSALSSTTPVFIAGIVLVLIFHDGLGQFDITYSLKDPAGKELLRTDEHTQGNKLDKGPMTLIVNVRPLQVHVGTYTFVTKLNGTAEYLRTFEIASL